MVDKAKDQKQDREDRAKAQEEHRKKMRGRPTPTQDEADQAKLGMHPELAADGSTDPFAAPTTTAAHANKQSTAESGGASYSTRQSTTKTAA